jgi:hypothetical protein
LLLLLALLFLLTPLLFLALLLLLLLFGCHVNAPFESARSIAARYDTCKKRARMKKRPRPL